MSNLGGVGTHFSRLDRENWKPHRPQTGWAYYILTRSDDDGGGLVVDGHGPVVGRHREPPTHLVEAPVHHGSVVGINLDSFFQHFQRQSLCTFRLRKLMFGGSDQLRFFILFARTELRRGNLSWDDRRGEGWSEVTKDKISSLWGYCGYLGPASQYLVITIITTNPPRHQQTKLLFSVLKVKFRFIPGFVNRKHLQRLLS